MANGEKENNCIGCKLGLPTITNGNTGAVRHVRPTGGPDISCTKDAPPVEINKATRSKVDSSFKGRVEVKIDTDNPPFLRVSVYSGVKKGFLREAKIEDQGSDRANMQAAAMAAGEAAEHLCRKYGDNLNPSECATIAVRLFDEGLRQLALDDTKDDVIADSMENLRPLN